jgi:hypothetical protein
MGYWGIGVLGYLEYGVRGRNHFYVLCHMLPMNTRGVATKKNDNKLGLTSDF